ncbi:MAG: fasciclin domain-containing protein [Erythrobacter sp.]|uniref:fasciclin domain-containing protein n=1 Tax=Erythrobacter sp. TaxID=1042 RepID=UPI002609DB26|nr:fasciclin domain-containing protein [Erythrobacter sp.]MDJ0978899.1 fasciclin domain-containing protein [Erythrobacter sp.]
MTSIPTHFKTAILAAFAASASITVATPALADGHMENEAGKPDIVATAMSTGSHETLVTAIKAAGLVETLQGPGPFTVFAPTDDGFAKLPDGTVATLVKPESKATLTKILTYHAVAGEVTAEALIGLIEAGDGAATVETLAGETLTARVVDGSVVITDAKGGTATVVAADVMTSNGVIHVTDGVFLPG